ncbi:hypothetical protein BC829DRAFT_95776 [Chytridium lagenaria]|nr:hypothetical protein BC829DRAFT_95776 [Chytridium lagenaria]
MDSNGRNDVGEDVVVEMGVDAGMAEEREVDQVREGDVVLDMGEMVMSSIGSISQEPFQPEDQPELVSPFQGQPDENNLQDQYDTGLPASVSTLASADIMPTQTFTRSLTRPYRESGLRNVSRREDSDDGPEHTEDDGEAAIPIHASRRTLKTNRRKSMLKDWKFSIRKGAEYTTDENELHLLHSPTPLKSSPAASSNLHPYATHLYEHRRLSYSTTLAPSHISIPIAHTPRPVLLHMPSPFVTFRNCTTA